MAALVIGNANYPIPGNLRNPVNDAADFAAKLDGYGFKTIILSDATVLKMERGLAKFRRLLEDHPVGLFFFAGHGMQISGQNFLLSVDTDMASELDAKHSSLSLDKVVEAMASSSAATKIIILDACRNNPWERRWSRNSASSGLASVYAPKGTIIGFATSPGEVASDGIGKNGTYTAALLQHIDTKDCSIEAMFKRVRNTVAAATNEKQTTWEHTSLSGEFYFNLSLGNLIEDYDGVALADSLFIVDPKWNSHKIIADLRSCNWYKQNPAIDRLVAASVNKMAKNSLFVVGRNIYQAACGYSTNASVYLNNFIQSTRGYEHQKRKAVLDGILFEIFFDSKGDLRELIKGEKFDEVFELQRLDELKDSFDFIADALISTGSPFYSVPGKGHELTATVSTSKVDGVIAISGIFIAAMNVLSQDEDATGGSVYDEIEPDELRSQLSLRFAVPERLLNIDFTPASVARASVLNIPVGWSVKRG